MKTKVFRLFTALTLLAAALPVRAQGQFVFGNRFSFPFQQFQDINAPVLDPEGKPLKGEAYYAQAYIGLDQESLSPIGTPVYFRTGNAAGYIFWTVVTTPFPVGTTIWAEMRAWDSFYASFEDAAGAGALRGRSNPVQLPVGIVPTDRDAVYSSTVPFFMIGLRSFQLVPEPSPLALGGFAALLWFARRRR